eukprot:87566_1
MSVKDFHTTSTWMHLSIVFSIIYVIVVSILLVIESKSFYQTFYGWKEPTTSSNRSKEANNTNCRLERAQSGSSIESHRTATNIDISKASAKPKPPSDEPNRTLLKLHVLPLLMYSFYVVTGIISTLFKLRIGSFSDCYPCGIQGIFFASGKLMLYLIFIYRLHAIYSDTAFQYNTKHLSIMAVITVFYTYCLTIVNMLTVSSVSVQIGGETYCDCVSVMLVPVVIFVADVTVMAVCCCAFIRPLKALQAHNSESRDVVLYRVVVKNMTLTCVSVITTLLIAIVIIGLKLNGLVGIDVIINSFCVFLMNSERDLWFKYLCFDGKCGSRAVECCCSTNETS